MGVFFIFKRLIGMLVQPLPAMVFLLLLGFGIRLCTRRKRWLTISSLSFVLALIVLILSASPPLTRWSARTLEREYRPLPLLDAATYAPCAIVVLGSGVEHPGDPALPALSRLNDTARARLVEGVRLARLYPEARLVTSGYGMGLENCADASALAAIELGVAASRIDKLPQSVDTGHEARLVKELAGERQVVLVTSAVHMPRSMGYFRGQGIDAVAAPCDFMAPVSDEALSTVNRHRWRPRGKNIGDTEETWHEYMGLFYFRWLRSAGSEN